MQVSSQAARWTAAALFLQVVAALAIGLGPGFVDVSRETRGHPLGQGGMVSAFVAIAVIVLGTQLFRAGLAFSLAVVNLWVLWVAAPVVYLGAVNAWLDPGIARPIRLTVVGKELQGRYGQVADPAQARGGVFSDSGSSVRQSIAWGPASRLDSSTRFLSEAPCRASSQPAAALRPSAILCSSSTSIARSAGVSAESAARSPSTNRAAALAASAAPAVVERCDALDGVADGLVQDTRACQARFNLQRDVPTCAGARDGTCLSQAQKLVIDSIAKGATLANGERFYAPFPYDAGLAGSNIAFWEFTASLNLDSGAVGTIFQVPPSTAPLANGAAFSMSLDVDATLPRLYATDATYAESAMSFMTPPDVRDYGDVRRRGAKMIVYHGVSDAIFSVADTVRWYHGVDHGSGGRADDFVRLYKIPGMNHCSGGPAADQADFITPLVKWVEQGVAPAAIVAGVRGTGNAAAVNTELPATWAPNRTRPLCPYPSIARYRGGDVEQASSFRCVGPSRGHR